MKFIVTAGGQGKKLWPYSRNNFPKQFQKIINDKSLYEINIDSLLKGFSPEDIYISTKKQYLKYAKEQAPEIPDKNFLTEPNAQKNRGPAEGLCFLKLSLLHPNDPFMIVQADDLRVPNEAYLKMIKAMEYQVKKDKKYITGGIKIPKPVMGSDYLELGEKVETDSGIEIFKVKDFLGRNSDYEETKKIIEHKGALVHANHGCWYPELMLDAYKKYRPDWHQALMKIKEVLGTADEEKEVERIYGNMERGSTEEVTKHVISQGYVVLLPFKWTDIGTWGSYYDFFAKDNEVLSDGQVVSLNSSGSLVKTTHPKKLVVVSNVNDLIVIDSEDAIFILPRKDEGKVNDIVDDLEKRGMSNYI